MAGHHFGHNRTEVSLFNGKPQALPGGLLTAGQRSWSAVKPKETAGRESHATGSLLESSSLSEPGAGDFGGRGDFRALLIHSTNWKDPLPRAGGWLSVEPAVLGGPEVGGLGCPGLADEHWMILLSSGNGGGKVGKEREEWGRGGKTWTDNSDTLVGRTGGRPFPPVLAGRATAVATGGRGSASRQL